MAKYRMSIRQYINIIKESYDDYEDDEGDAPPTLESHVLEAGSTLYHGTNGKFDERYGLNSPAWVTDSIETAKYFAKWKDDSGKPRLTLWTVRQSANLAVLTSEYLEYLSEELMIDMTDGPEDILQHLRQKGFEGWIIPDNYGTQQADICLGDTSILEYVKTNRL